MGKKRSTVRDQEKSGRFSSYSVGFSYHTTPPMLALRARINAEQRKKCIAAYNALFRYIGKHRTAYDAYKIVNPAFFVVTRQDVLSWLSEYYSGYINGVKIVYRIDCPLAPNDITVDDFDWDELGMGFVPDKRDLYNDVTEAPKMVQGLGLNFDNSVSDENQPSISTTKENNVLANHFILISLLCSVVAIALGYLVYRLYRNISSSNSKVKQKDADIQNSDVVLTSIIVNQGVDSYETANKQDASMDYMNIA